MRKDTNMLARDLFSTVSPKDYIGEMAESNRSKNVVNFLELSKNDVAKATDQTKASIRYDERIPQELESRLLEIGNIINLVTNHFDGDLEKTRLWFNTSNPLLGNVSPRNMIRVGRYRKLRKFVMNATSGDLP